MRAVVGVDLSRPSMDAARWVGEHFLPETPVDLIYSLEAPTIPGFLQVQDRGHEEIMDRATQIAQDALNNLALSIDPDRVETAVSIGGAPDVLTAEARARDADIIAVGPHGGHGRPGFFGSTASRIIREARFPVLVCRNTPEGGLRRIVVALDESEPARAALRLAAGLALHHECHLIAMYSFDTIVDGLPDDPMGALLGDEAKDACHRWMRERLLDVRMGPERSETRITHGHPGHQLCTLAEEADLIVMGSHGKPMGGEAFGSVARYVIGHAPCPVLVVPGPGG